MKETFKDLSIRARMGYLTAMISFTAGWFLTGYNFFQSDNCEVQDSTLFILAQALTYTGAVIGITEYVKGEFRNFRKEMRNSTETPTEE